MSTHSFRVGYNRITVEPTESIPLSGFSNEPKRFHKEIGQPICVSCVAITDDQDNTVLMVGMDICVCDGFFMDIADDISTQLNVPKDHIYMAGTHTHAAPAVGWRDEIPAAKRYADKFIEAIFTVCKEAMADRKPASMFTGSIETENMNFVKHYKCISRTGPEISYIGDCFGDPNKVIYLEHATKADPTMHVTKFVREGGKDVVIANFRAHPHFDGGAQKYILSSDYIGAFRNALESMVDCHSVYFQGAAGNINSSTRLPSERRYTTAVSYGLGLAGFCAECLAKRMSPAATGTIRTSQVKFFGHINHTMDHLAEVGKRLRKQWNIDYDTEKCMKEASNYGIRSPFHAGAIWWNSERTDEDDGWMILNAVAIGDDFAFVTFPGEMFDSISVRMEENSPFFTTMMLGYCGHHLGYLPSRVAYKYTSYETDITRFAPGTGEMVADKHVEMLNELKNRK